MKKNILLAVLLVTSTSQSFAFLASNLLVDESTNLCSGKRGTDLAFCMLSPTATTTIPTVLILDSGEQFSITENLLELEAEINSGPQGYYYLTALAKQISSDPKYNGDMERALNDVIAQVKAIGESQRSSAP